jgi:predicted ArsR family transcriptional regulator
LDKTKSGGTRERMRDQCLALQKLLSSRDRISMREISESLSMHPVTVRRWMDSFSLVMDLRIERGTVIIERRAEPGGGQAPTSKRLI